MNVNSMSKRLAAVNLQLIRRLLIFLSWAFETSLLIQKIFFNTFNQRL